MTEPTQAELLEALEQAIGTFDNSIDWGPEEDDPHVVMLNLLRKHKHAMAAVVELIKERDRLARILNILCDSAVVVIDSINGDVVDLKEISWLQMASSKAYKILDELELIPPLAAAQPVDTT